jgi:3'(2'), 5'-bisphosphate nucleotidase
VLVAAGGRFTDLDGVPIDYASADLVLRNGLVASNGALHEAVVEAIRAERA